MVEIIFNYYLPLIFLLLLPLILIWMIIGIFFIIGDKYFNKFKNGFEGSKMMGFFGIILILFMISLFVAEIMIDKGIVSIIILISIFLIYSNYMAYEMLNEKEYKINKLEEEMEELKEDEDYI